MTTRRRRPQPDGNGLDYIAAPLRSLAVAIETLVPDPANARLHGDKNLDAIKASLRTFGQVKPVVVREETNVVVCGNGTLNAAQSLGWTHLAAVAKSMDAATAAALAIADNRTAELATWDPDALGRLMSEIETGDAELQKMLDDLAKEKGIGPEEADAAAPSDIPEQYNILVECETEQQQAALLERLDAEGFKCRSLIS